MPAELLMTGLWKEIDIGDSLNVFLFFCKAVCLNILNLKLIHLSKLTAYKI